MWIALIALIGTAGSSAFTYRTSRATTAVEQSKVDAAAFERAKAIYESALTTLEEQLERMRIRLDTVTSQLAQEQDTSSAMRVKVRALEAQVALFEQTVAELRRQLAMSGIPVKED